MSLRVWLPLNGNLRNLGLSEITCTNDGSTVEANGKIGSCYSFNNTRIIIDSTELQQIFSSTTQPFSFSTWIYLNSDETDRVIIFGNYNANPFVNWELTASCAPRLCVGGISNYTTKKNSTVVPKTTWTHIAVTYDGTTTTFYQNGVLLGTVTGANTLTSKTASSRFYLGGDTRTGATRLKGRLNDFRIYDHCLSTAEVHEISQGLILHYKLDSFYNGQGNLNLCKNSRTFGSGWSGSGAITQNVFEGFAMKYKDNSSGSSYTDIAVYNNVLTVNPEEVYTVSFWAKANTEHNVTCYFYNNTSGVVQSARSIASTGASGTAGDGATTIALTTQWTYYWITWTFKNTGTAAAKTLLLCRNPASGSGVSIAKVKLERGGTATPWSPHPDDEEYISENYVVDNSGYGHKGTIIGELILTQDSAHYSNGTKWNSSAPTTNNETGICYIQTPITLTTPLQMSITWWAKPESGYNGTTSHAVFCTSNNASRPTDYNSTAFHHRDSGFDIYPSDGSGAKRLSFTYTQNVWHHYAVTYDGTTAKTYQDGILKTSITVGTNKTLATFSQLYIGYSQAGGVKRKTLGTYSDFRIYCTALSENDILTLYHTGAKIDKIGKLHTFEFNENNVNKLTKRGIFYNYQVEPYLTLSDGSQWELLLYHWVDNGNNLFTQAEASHCSKFGLYSRLDEIDNFIYDNKYEFYVIQDGTQFRWTQTNKPTATSIAGLTTVSGYNNSVNGLAKPSNNTRTYIGYNSWWGACGCWTSYSLSGKTGIPGFGPHDSNGVCTKYLALYARIDHISNRLSNGTTLSTELIEF